MGERVCTVVRQGIEMLIISLLGSNRMEFGVVVARYWLSKPNLNLFDWRWNCSSNCAVNLQ